MRIGTELMSRADPSDVVQETQIVITKRIKDFLQHRPVSFRIWLRRTALEQLVDQRRRHIGAEKRSVRREKEIVDSSLAIARTLYTETPSKISRKDELQKQILDMIDSLGKTDREILNLRHAEGLSNAEAADLLEINPDNEIRISRDTEAVYEVPFGMALAVDGTSNQIAICAPTNDVLLWDLDEAETHRLGGHEDVVMSLAISRDARLVASGDSAGSIRLWDTETKKQIDEFRFRTGARLYWRQVICQRR